LFSILYREVEEHKNAFLKLSSTYYILKLKHLTKEREREKNPNKRAIYQKSSPMSPFF